jgi:hypothetical protein
LLGAPSCSEDDPLSEQSRLRANPSKDIWSLGCVFSEAAVWSVFGVEGLEKYRKQRTAATNVIPKLRNTAYNGCFHDGEKVLQIVTDMHAQVLRHSQCDDYIVSDIINIVGEMLGHQPIRPTAASLYRYLRTALTTAEACLKRERDDANDASFLEAPQSFQDPHNFRAQPPELPSTGLGVRMFQELPQLPYTISLHPSYPDPRHYLWPVPDPTPEGDQRTSAVNRVQSNNVHSSLISTYASSEHSVHTTIPELIQNGTDTWTDTWMDQRHQDYPRTSVGQVLDWIAKKKTNPATKPLCDDPTLRRLHGRDQVGNFSVRS